ncbi:MAG TPA: class I SAM-dependent methyltransferase [Polyangiaceae bacterium]|nr:class I SAM-dependent methyltransferase [Polyangiaceae bacterium]
MIPDAYFDRFETPKYRRRSRVRRALIRRFVRRLHEFVLDAGPVSSVLEIGVGEGFLSGYLSEKLPTVRFSGVDASAEALARLQRLFPRIETRVGDAYDLSGLGGPFDLVLCAEVLEHLHQPARALDAIASLRPRRAVLTVPHEPFFRLSNLASGANVTRLGNDPEHVQQFGPRSFRKLLSSRFEVLALTTSYPWILALTAPR